AGNGAAATASLPGPCWKARRAKRMPMAIVRLRPPNWRASPAPRSAGRPTRDRTLNRCRAAAANWWSRRCRIRPPAAEARESRRIIKRSQISNLKSQILDLRAVGLLFEHPDLEMRLQFGRGIDAMRGLLKVGVGGVIDIHELLGVAVDQGEPTALD